MKVRRIDFYPDEWLVGTALLAAEERGVYITICALIYSRGTAIQADGLAKLCGLHGNAFRKVKSRLIELGKIEETSGKILVKRCETELIRARNRLETAEKNGGKGGRPAHEANKTNGLDKPGGLSGEKLAGASFNYQLSTNTLSNESDAREPRRTHTADFERWWSRYPHKVGKGAARKAFERALTKTSADQLGIGVERYKASKPEGREWCNPATWLNQERWNDMPAAEIKLNGASGGATLPLLDDMRRPSGPPPASL